MVFSEDNLVWSMVAFVWDGLIRGHVGLELNLRKRCTTSILRDRGLPFKLQLYVVVIFFLAMINKDVERWHRLDCCVIFQHRQASLWNPRGKYLFNYGSCVLSLQNLMKLPAENVFRCPVFHVNPYQHTLDDFTKISNRFFLLKL